MAFNENPCRRNAFDVFLLDKSETDVKSIRRVVRETRESWSFRGGKLTDREGAEFTLSEAKLNAMESVLLDPVARLKQEQFVHQAHLAVRDEALARLVAQLLPHPHLRFPMEDSSVSLVAALGRFLPPPAPEPLADDLPWPESPGPFAPAREPLEEAILREE